MGFNIANILSGGTGNLIESIGNTIGKFVTTKEEKEQLNIELQKVIIAHEEKMADLTQAELNAYLADSQSARDTYSKIEESENASWLSKNILPILALTITIGFFGLLIYMFGNTVPKDNERILDIMLGSLGTAWVTVVSFFFGSSMSSHAKDTTLRSIVSNK